MTVLKKIFKFLSSMTFAIILLVILAIACVIASFVTQGQSYEWYAATYSERAASWITALRLDDAFHSWWFLAISLFLCLNLLLCNVIRLPQLIRRTRAEGSAAHAVKTETDVFAGGVTDPLPVFSRLRLPAPKQTEQDGRTVLFASKNRIGLWGAWVCHIGILLLIAGFALGQATRAEYTVYGVPGQSKPVGDSALALTIDDFRIDLREDDTVEQYTADITVRDLSGKNGVEGQSATVSVNHPATLFGYRFYQNSTGWAANISVTKNGAPLESETVCVGEGLHMADQTDLVVYFNAFYPDYVFDAEKGPMTASGALKNPAYLYSVYYQEQPVGMNVLLPGETIKINDYEIAFSDPQSYTLIQIKKDRFTPLALAGGLLTLLGLFLALYLLPTRAWAIREEDGSWTVYGASGKRGPLFREEFDRAVSGKTGFDD